MDLHQRLYIGWHDTSKTTLSCNAKILNVLAGRGYSRVGCLLQDGPGRGRACQSDLNFPRDPFGHHRERTGFLIWIRFKIGILFYYGELPVRPLFPRTCLAVRYCLEMATEYRWQRCRRRRRYFRARRYQRDVRLQRLVSRTLHTLLRFNFALRRTAQLRPHPGIGSVTNQLSIGRVHTPV
jgi:hypothetical protein